MGRTSALTRAARMTCALLPALAATAGGCGDKTQLVVIIDTDLATPAQAAKDPSFAHAATFDRVDVQVLGDVLPGAGFRDIVASAEFVIGPETPWPITFGVAESDNGERFVRLRIMAYRGDARLRTTTALMGADFRQRVERLAYVRVPESGGRQKVRVVLRGDCLGINANTEKDTSCITGPGDVRDPTDVVEHDGDFDRTEAGTWRRDHLLPCITTPPQNATDTRCIRGGLLARGDSAFDQDYAAPDYVTAGPPHLVHLSPFHLDRVEMTVRRFRALVARGAIPGVPMPSLPASGSLALCTWTDTPGATEDDPLTCVGPDTARAACRAEGGDLPTDAQWEQAASSNGTRRPWVWGTSQPTCCASNVAGTFGCVGNGTSMYPLHDRPQRAGTFADAAKCGALADVTRDDVVDLGGNVREIALDAARIYLDRDCAFKEGVQDDPVCAPNTARARVARGASFRSTFDRAKLTVRTTAIAADDLGFRCAYRGVP